MIANEKIGQTPAEFDNLIDNTFKVVCGMNFRKGNQFIFATSDPTKLQSIRGRLFMVYSWYSMLQNHSYQKFFPRRK